MGNKTILLIDDSEDNQFLVSRMLKKNDYNVLISDSGKSAFRILENETVDLILLDFVMPEMGGIEVCRALKRDLKTVSIPVIFLSGNSSSDNIVNALEAGAVDYISFPFNESEIIARIETHLKIASLEHENNQQLKKIQGINKIMEDELEIARKIQQTIVMLKFPISDDFQITSYYKPVGKVGGDIISYKERNDGSLNFFFGDISGHGVSAALLSGMYVLAFDISSRFDCGPKEHLQIINDMIAKFAKDFFLSAILFRYIPSSKKIIYSYAGHHPMLVIRDGEIIPLPGTGNPLNIFPEIHLIEKTFQLIQGDKLFLFSDGLFEFWEDKREIFGYEGFINSLPKFSNLHGYNFLESISNEMFLISKNRIMDDVSMLLIEV
ncbi:MAG: fused response regulator/phosphatase [Leptospiraceae bacterium]|nr:fused response regulator/phosphatase [Leptospiraceae bacterium]MCK6381612.1 fused response regulator/phosphatase [Leptospiraceae bacterium]NUM41145.1 fused response regulator/phosphatase [Leptospiraceae bacterium]